MRIHTKLVFDIASMALVEDEFYEYAGEVDLAKGADTATDQLNKQNALTQQQLQRQQGIQDNVLSNLQKYLSGDVGFGDQQMAQLQSQFLNNSDQAFQGAGSDVRSALAARGAGTGNLPAGGDYTQGLQALMAARAGNQSSGILGLGIQNAQQALQNKFNTANIFSGQAAQSGNNVGTFNSGASNALNQYISAANQGFGAAFTKSFGGALGGALGQGVSAGIGKIPGL